MRQFIGGLLPIRENGDDFIGFGRVVGWQMQAEVMQPAHGPMHKEFHADGCAFAWFDGHRTDGRGGRSTAFQNFNVRRFSEPEGLIANIGDLHHRADRHPAQLDGAIIIDILGDLELRSTDNLDAGILTT